MLRTLYSERQCQGSRISGPLVGALLQVRFYSSCFQAFFKRKPYFFPTSVQGPAGLVGAGAWCPCLCRALRGCAVPCVRRPLACVPCCLVPCRARALLCAMLFGAMLCPWCAWPGLLCVVARVVSSPLRALVFCRYSRWWVLVWAWDACAFCRLLGLIYAVKCQDISTYCIFQVSSS